MSVRFIFYEAFFLLLLLTCFFLNHLKISSKISFNKEIESTKTGDNRNIIKLDKKLLSSLGLKYILRWTSSLNYLSIYMGSGQERFVRRNCTYKNCFVTSDRSFLGGAQNFDIVLFAGVEMIYYNKKYLPKIRSPHQKYVFANMESADRYPVCTGYMNDFFNWTWTYKTNSDIRWSYIAIRDSDGTLIGPNSIMHWMKFEDMKPVSDEFKEKLKSKKIAVAWFVTRCYSRSRREELVKELQNELTKYNLDLDIYGRCGPYICPRKDQKTCLKMLGENYYFYLSFENSFSEDYVTEKLLYALQHNTIPIVYGAANYTRFMPDGIYLNARELGAEILAEKINELILNPEKYAEYFRWQNHYSYHTRNKLKKTDDICNFCKMINDKALVEKVSRYKDFKKWWNPPHRC